MQDFTYYATSPYVAVAAAAAFFIAALVYIVVSSRRNKLMPDRAIALAMGGFLAGVLVLSVNGATDAIRMPAERIEAVERTYGIELTADQYKELQFPSDRPHSRQSYGTTTLPTGDVRLEFTGGEYRLVAVDYSELNRPVTSND